MVLDFGCGYGAIGLALAKMYKESLFYLLDNDLKTEKCINKNIEINNLKNCLFYLNDGLGGIEVEFDVIVSHFPMHISNSEKKRLLNDLINKTKRGGKLIFVIQEIYNFTNFFTECPDVKLIEKRMVGQQCKYNIFEYEHIC